MKKYFQLFILMTIFIAPFCSINASDFNLKKDIKNIATTVKSAPTLLSSFVKNRANDISDIKEGGKTASVAFKKGKLKEGLKDVEGSLYAATNLLTLGGSGTLVEGEKRFYKGAKEVHQGNKHGWKMMSEGAVDTALGTARIMLIV